MTVLMIHLPLPILYRIVFGYFTQHEMWYQVRLLNQLFSKSFPSPYLYLSFGTCCGKLSLQKYLSDDSFRRRIRGLLLNPRHQISLHFLHHVNDPASNFDPTTIDSIDLIVIWGSESLRSVQGIEVARRVKLFFCSNIVNFRPLAKVFSVSLDSVLVPNIGDLSGIHSLSLTRMPPIDLAKLHDIKRITLYNIDVDLRYLSTSVEFLSLHDYYRELDLSPLITRRESFQLEIQNGYGLYYLDQLRKLGSFSIETMNWVFEEHFQFDYGLVTSTAMRFYETDCPESRNYEANQIFSSICILNDMIMKSVNHRWLAAHPITPLQMKLINCFQPLYTMHTPPSSVVRSALTKLVLVLAYKFDNQYQGWEVNYSDGIFFHFPFSAVRINKISAIMFNFGLTRGQHYIRDYYLLKREA